MSPFKVLHSPDHHRFLLLKIVSPEGTPPAIRESRVHNSPAHRIRTRIALGQTFAENSAESVILDNFLR